MRILVLSLVVVVTGCAAPGINTALYRDGAWQGVSGPAVLADFAICEIDGASGNDLVSEPIERKLVPRVERALKKPPGTLRAKRVSQRTDFCAELGKLNRDNFELTARLKKLIDAAFAECGTCNTIIIPAAYVWVSASTSAVTSNNGTVVARIENGGSYANGQFIARLYVFTRDGQLALNNGATFVPYAMPLATELERKSDGLIAQLTTSFPWEVLH